MPASPTPRLLPLLWMAILAVGVAVGALVVALADMEIKWIVYAAAGLLFFTVLCMVRYREALLWIILILVLQIDVSVRVLYGYAGSHGLVFPAPAVIGLILLTWYLFSGHIRSLQPIRWGGGIGAAICGVFLTMIGAMLVSDERFVGLTALLSQFELYLIFWLALNSIRTQEQWERAVKLLLLLLAIQSIIYFIQSALGMTFNLIGETVTAGALPRPGGTVGTTPHTFANFILPLLLIAATQFVATQRSILPRWQIGLLVLLGVGALGLTLARAAFGAFFLAVACMIFWGWRRRMLSLRKLVMFAGYSVAAAIVAIPPVVARLESNPLEGSYNERKALMEMAVNVIEAHPLTGVGPGAYEESYKRYLTPELAQKWVYAVHNHYLLRTAESGIPGGLAFIFLLLMGLRQALRLASSPDPIRSAVALAWAGAIAGYCFEMYWDMWISFTTHSLFWFMLGIMGAAEALERLERQPVVAPTTEQGMAPS